MELGNGFRRSVPEGRENKEQCSHEAQRMEEKADGS